MKIVTRATAIKNLKKYIGKDLAELAPKFGINPYLNGKQNKGWKGLVLGRLAGLQTNVSKAPNGLTYELKSVAFHEIKGILVPKETYWDAMDVVPLIVLANFFLGIYTNLSVWYKLIDKTKIGAYISIVGAIVTLVLNLILIPFISYMGSAIATILAYGTMMFISYYMGQKKYPIPYDKKSIFTYL